MRALVTGGAGFIGSSLANALAADGHDVVALDDLSLGTWDNVDPGVTPVTASVLEDGLPVDVDVVFHLAALSSYDMHEAEPARGCRVNVEGFVNTLEQAAAAGCDTVVYASTSSVYGDRTSPSPEEMRVSASTGYEASKLARERYAEYYSAHRGLDCCGLRFFSVYEGMHGAEGHKGGYANLIAQFAEDVAGGRRPELYGDGTQTRDFTHVDDVVRACRAAAGLDGVYNVGTGEQHSLLELVDRINGLLGTDVEPRLVENPIDENAYVHDTLADTRRIGAATGWEPEVSFEEGTRRVCAPYMD